MDKIMDGNKSLSFYNAILLFAGIFILVITVYGCTPTVKVAAPDKPITINLNVKIQHEIRVKVEKDLEDMFSEESGLF